MGSIPTPGTTERTGVERIGGERSGLDWIGLERIGLGVEGTGLDWIGREGTGLDGIGFWHGIQVRLTGAVCNIAGLRLRRFKSCPCHYGLERIA